MKNIVFITILLILASSNAASASINSSKNTSIKSNNTIYLFITEKLDKSFTTTNTVSYLTKYQTKKFSSRKSRMNTIQNFLKNPEKKEDTVLVLC